jgi:hypothetical protein
MAADGGEGASLPNRVAEIGQIPSETNEQNGTWWVHYVRKNFDRLSLPYGQLLACALSCQSNVLTIF